MQRGRQPSQYRILPPQFRQEFFKFAAEIPNPLPIHHFHQSPSRPCSVFNAEITQQTPEVWRDQVRSPGFSPSASSPRPRVAASPRPVLPRGAARPSSRAADHAARIARACPEMRTDVPHVRNRSAFAVSSFLRFCVCFVFRASYFVLARIFGHTRNRTSPVRYQCIGRSLRVECSDSQRLAGSCDGAGGLRYNGCGRMRVP